MNALAEAWAKEPEQTSIAERLCRFAELAAAACENGRGGIVSADPPSFSSPSPRARHAAPLPI